MQQSGAIIMQDRNFDDLADKFSQNIYGTRKGQVRQAIVWDELEALLPTLPAGPLQVRGTNLKRAGGTRPSGGAVRSLC